MNSFRPIEIFREITAIPRDSGDEKRIAEYLLAFAAHSGLDAQTDSVNNVIIRKPGSPGRENESVFVLQSHSDMVYIKEETSGHDYNSPLVLEEKDGFLRAIGTSLGADNGIGIAFALALLESKDISHPPLEALFTSGEEVGMDGAAALQPGLITGRRMLNLDSEEEGHFVTGCAGGLRAELSLEPEWRDVPQGYECIRVFIKGLKGGHSGVDIDKGRGNAIRLLGRLLMAASNTLGALVGQISGGSKSNAIPDRAQAVIFVSDVDAFRALAEECLSAFRAELQGSDDLDIVIEPGDNEKEALTEKSLKQILLLILNIPNGIQSMSQQLPGLVESSNNIGVLQSSHNVITINCAIRSSKTSLKLHIRDQISTLAEAAGARLKLDSDYPAWDYAVDSPLREQALQVYRDLFKTEPVVYALHAGLECGYFKALYPDMDIISTGPNLYNVHTPQEKMDIESAKRVWEWLVKLMFV